MLSINRVEVKHIVKVMEYILAHETDVSVDTLMNACKIDFDEYRLISELSMPAIRRKNELASMKAQMCYYKNEYLREKKNREKMDRDLRKVRECLDNYFKEEK